MSSLLLKGSAVAEGIRERMFPILEKLKGSGVVPGLAIVRIGEKEDDLAYERGAVKKMASLGIDCQVKALPADASTEDCLRVLALLNRDGAVHGILLLRPLPEHMDSRAIREAVAPEKDVDCMHPASIARLFEGDPGGFAPCTPRAVMEMIRHYGIETEGKRVTVIGRSMVVGKPLAMMLLGRHATITVCHTRTRDLAAVCRQAEILVAAAGKARMVTADFVSSGQTVIDVGMNVDANGRLCGDVDFDAVEPIVAAITPVPGGVGSVTTSVLAEQVLQAAAKASS